MGVLVKEIETHDSELTGRCLTHYTMKKFQIEWLKMKIYLSGSKLLRPCKKFAAILEQNCKVNIDQHALKIIQSCID